MDAEDEALDYDASDGEDRKWHDSTRSRVGEARETWRAMGDDGQRETDRQKRQWPLFLSRLCLARSYLASLFMLAGSSVAVSILTY